MMKVWGIGVWVYIMLSLLYLSMATSANGAIEQGSIVAAWLFDEGSGQVAHDSSENGNDAEFQGAPEWVDGKFGKALRFDGGADYVAAPDSDSLDVSGDQLSMVVWLNGEAWPAANHVIRKVADVAQAHLYVLRIQPETVRVIMNTNGADSTIDGGTMLPTGEWMHIAAVYDGSEVRIYVNGELDGSAPVAGDITQSDAELRIGRGDPAGYFQGTIDEVAILEAALTEEDIRDIMEAGLGKLALSVKPVGKLPMTWAEIKVMY